MKKLFCLIVALFAFETYACSCSKYPLSGDEALEEFIKASYGAEARIGEGSVTWLRYHPTVYERTFENEFMGTSCGSKGPNGEPMFHCSAREKSDLLLKFPELNCEAVIRMTTTYARVKIKELRSNCPSPR